MIFLRNSIFTLLVLISFNSTAFSSVLYDIVQSGVLKVGTTGDFPGWSFKNPETNKYEGFDIDAAIGLGEKGIHTLIKSIGLANTKSKNVFKPVGDVTLISPFNFPEIKSIPAK